MRPLSFGLLAGSLTWLTGCAGVTATTRDKPPIDADAPAKVETATFALG